MYVFVIIMCVNKRYSAVSSVVTAMTPKEYHELIKKLAMMNEYSKTGKKRFPQVDETKAKLFDNFRPRRYLYNSVSTQVYGDSKCPTRHDIMAKRSFQVCPAYFVSEYDPNRIPSTIFQVRCKCLSCHGPRHKQRHRKCSPLFKFINAYRVVDITSNGTNIYAKVREPVSYSCQCRKGVLGARKTYIPP